MNDAVIRVEGVSKQYRIGVPLAKRERAWERFRHLAASPFGYLRQISREPTVAETLWALNGVSFEVGRGEVLGVIGRNGSGKSTLLRILSRITEPTAGRVEIRGRVGSLLEVGTGFHPELTGRENIYLNGAVLGMRRRDIERRFDEIVAFSEVSRFIDTPVKRYSTGMYVRLAFAVAAHLEPAILLVDEVLAVGDLGFQKKCLGKMGEVANQGRTVLLVSHNMALTRSLCNRVLWLADGQVVTVGDTRHVINDYMSGACPEFGLGSGGPLSIRKVLLRDSHGEETTTFAFGEDVTVEIHYHAREPLPGPHFFIGIGSKFGPVCVASMIADGRRPEFISGDGMVRCTFRRPLLLPSHIYGITIGARYQNATTPLIDSTEALFFTIDSSARELGFHGEFADADMAVSGPVFVPYEWRMPDGTPAVVDAEPKRRFAAGGSSGRRTVPVGT